MISGVIYIGIMFVAIYTVWTLFEWELLLKATPFIYGGVILAYELYTLYLQRFYSEEVSFLIVIFLSVLLLGATIDKAYYILPDTECYVLILSGLIYRFLVGNFENSVCIALIIVSISYGLRFISNDGLGIGDVKWFGAISIWLDGPNIVTMFIFSFYLGCLYLILLYSKYKKLPKIIPFGPFICISGYINFF